MPVVLGRKLLLSTIVVFVLMAVPAATIGPAGLTAAGQACASSTTTGALGAALAPIGTAAAGDAGGAAANGSTVYVSAGATDGNGSASAPYGTIQAGVDDAERGDTVVVAAGTYGESVRINESVHVVAEDGAVLNGTDGNGTAFHVESTTHALESISIRGFEIENYHTGIEVASCNQAGDAYTDLQDVAIEDNTIRDVERGIAVDVYHGTSMNLTVANNTVANASERGISVYAHQNATNTGTTIAHNDLSGGVDGPAILLWAQDADVSNATIHGNDGSNAEIGLEVSLQGSSTIERTDVTRNTFSDAAGDTVENATNRSTDAGHGVSVSASDATSVRDVRLAENVLEGNAGDGIRLVAEDDSTIATIHVSANQVAGSGDDGVSLVTRDSGLMADVHVERNEIADNARGVAIDGAATGGVEDVTVERNTIAENDEAGVVVTGETHPAGIAVHYNVIEENGAGVDNRNENDVLDARFNWWGDASGPSTDSGAAGSPVADPVTDTPADGQGDSVSEGTTDGVSNVRFDPALTGDSQSATQSSSGSDWFDVVMFGPGNATVTIGNAAAGEPVNVAFEDGLGYDGVYLDGLDLELNRDADEIELGVQHREAAPGETPELELVGDADRYVTVEKAGITDDDVDAVRFHFRLSEAALGDRSPENVALYRYDDGWTELPTTFVEQRDDGYVFRASSPGFSAFAVGVDESRFEVTGADVEPTTVTVDEAATVSASIENTGDAAGTFTAEVTADGDTVAERDVTLDAGESTTVEFEVAFDETGEYDIAVNGTAAGTVAVEAAPTPEPTTTESTSATTESTNTTESTESDIPVLGISLVVVLLVALIATALYFRADLRQRLGR